MQIGHYCKYIIIIFQQDAHRCRRLRHGLPHVLDPATAIRQLVSFTWQYELDHPEFLTLLDSDNRHHGTHLKDTDSIERTNSPLVETIEPILEQGRKSGAFRAGVDPVRFDISIAALSYFYLSNNDTPSKIFARHPMQQKAKAERLSHMTDLVPGYLLRQVSCRVRLRLPLAP